MLGWKNIILHRAHKAYRHPKITYFCKLIKSNRYQNCANSARQQTQAQEVSATNVRNEERLRESISLWVVRKV